MDNKDVIQSYILTSAKYSYTVYEKRILYRIVELMQSNLQGKKLNQNYSFERNLLNDIEIELPFSAFVKDEKDFNYNRIKEAFIKLQKNVISYTNKDGEDCSTNLIERVKTNKNSHIAKFRLPEDIASVFLDFSKGYSKYELITAMSFDSIYSMRLYELISNQKHPISYTIERLKEIFNIVDKYKLNSDFMRNTINVAKKELTEKSPYTFEYKINKKDRKFYSITFYPIYQPNKRDDFIEQKKLQKQTSIRWELDEVVIKYLTENFGFNNKEINNNRDVFVQGSKDLDLLNLLAELKGKISDIKNPKGYVINAIKKQLNG